MIDRVVLFDWEQTGCLFAAAGDGCAYAWDMETGKNTMVFQGHSDYLHCIASRPSHNQVHHPITPLSGGWVGGVSSV
jgi:WD40 repeat protein